MGHTLIDILNSILSYYWSNYKEVSDFVLTKDMKKELRKELVGHKKFKNIKTFTGLDSEFGIIGVKTGKNFIVKIRNK